MHFRLLPALCLALCLTLLQACASQRTAPPRPTSGFTPTQLAKSDIDRVVEAHQQEVFHNLRILAEKLYRRNPREFRKSRQSTVDVAVARIFDVHHDWKFPDLRGARDTQAIQLALREDYQGDRVLAYVVGVASMIQTAFHNKTEFFVIDDLDAQGLYNAARNVEIAVWKLSNARNRSNIPGAQGELLLLSNEATVAVSNLSFEREFGKVIGSLDILSKIAADKHNRAIVKVVQTLASAVFLPIK
jgi:hypothetical protein